MNPAFETFDVEGGVPIRAWTRGVPFEDSARQQLVNAARLPFIHRWIAAMPDVHLGIGATVGSVIPCVGAIVPAAVGVDIGCGMLAVRTTLMAEDLPDDLRRVRTVIEKAVPHGRTDGGQRNDRGAWRNLPDRHAGAARELDSGYRAIVRKHAKLDRGNTFNHLGTLGTGNHFIELCLAGDARAWFMLHSGSRGVGNRVGSYFIELAKKDMGAALGTLPDTDLAYLKEGTSHFDDYVEAVGWAQRFARTNRELMMQHLLEALGASQLLPPFRADDIVVNCHHNYVAREQHFGKDVWLTRKGAVRAGRGELGIIPGSMGARSYIVRGKGSADSFESCSHGAGRALSRTEAKRRFTVEDHVQATAGIECRKDASVIDETPMAYKSIEAVMAAQADLVEVVHELRQVLCVKG